jgi:hypothetical protein
MLAANTAYPERVAHADQTAALISAPDKLQNVTANWPEVREQGPGTLAPFKLSCGVSWYYRAIAVGSGSAR